MPQVIDDVKGCTIASASSLELEIKGSAGQGPKTELSKRVGAAIAQRALMKGASRVVFDRGGYKYHGRVKALAEAAREGGLVFLMVSVLPRLAGGKIDAAPLALNERVVFTRRIAKVVKGDVICVSMPLWLWVMERGLSGRASERR